MEQLEIDGVRVVWQPAPGPLRAALMFRVGRRDETFVTGGITHLVEHLAMSVLPRSHVERNATVDIGTTTFTVTGRPEQVVDFLGSVCEALADLPMQRLAVEAAVLRAENGFVDHPSLTQLLVRRYGARGSGLAGMGEPALGALTEEQVRAYAARHFVRGNAVLTLTGPPPPGLRLPLPPGAPPEREPNVPLPLPLPAWSDHPVDGVAVSLLAADDEALGAGMRILRDRLEDDLRRDRGLVYEVDWSGVRTGKDTVHVGLYLDPKRADVPEVAQAAARALRAMADRGPTDDELAHDLEGFVEVMADERAVPEHLDSFAADLLNGLTPPTLEDRLAERRRVTAARVREVFRAALPSLYVLVPEEVDLDRAAGDLGLPREPDSVFAPVTGRVVKRRLLSAAPRGATLTLADAGITLTVPGLTTTVLFDDAVAVIEDPDGERRLVGIDGHNIPLVESDWKDGEAVLAAVRARVPAHLWVRGDPDDD